MDIPALSMAMSSAALSQQASVQVLSMNLDNMRDLGDGMRKMLEMSVSPNVGGNIDVSV